MTPNVSFVDSSGALMEYGFAYTVCRRAVFYYGNGPAWKLKGGAVGQLSEGLF